MATISNTPRPGYVWDSTDNVWYPIGVGGHAHPDYITQATAVNPTLIDAKGDIITATAADTPARLAVGNNGETLVADSSTSTGLRYTAGNPIGNPTINSAFQVWQRGTSFAVNAQTYTADRWVGYRGATGMTVSRQVTGDTTNLPNIQYCARVQRDSGNATTGALQFGQMFETVNSIPYVGKTVTFSFYARAGANYSSASGMSAYLVTGTGTDQNYFTAYTGSAFNGVTTTLTTTWQRFQGTFSLSSSATEFAIVCSYTPTGTAGVNDYFEITGVQIDIGSVALPFRTYAATIQGELAACQRYYLKSYNQATAPATASNTVGNTGYSAISATAVNNRWNVRFPVNMRGTPTVTIYSTNSGTSAKIYNEQTAADVDGVTQFIGESGFHLYTSSGSPTAGHQLLAHYQASAEL